ncbi:MAG: hypothetical protein ABEJ07_03750 [Candidatus Nanohaloarchaea archaeon]
MAILHKIRDPGGGSRRDSAFSYASNGFRAVGLDAVPDKLDDARAWGIANPRGELAAVTIGPPAADLVFNGGQGIDAWGDFLLDGEAGRLVEEFPLNEYPGNVIEMAGETVKAGVETVDETPNNSPVYWLGEGIEGLGELVGDPVQFFESGLEEGGTVHIGPVDIGVPGYDVSGIGGNDTEYFDGSILDGWFGYEPSDAGGAGTPTATPAGTETPAGTATETPAGTPAETSTPAPTETSGGGACELDQATHEQLNRNADAYNTHNIHNIERNGETLQVDYQVTTESGEEVMQTAEISYDELDMSSSEVELFRSLSESEVENLLEQYAADEGEVCGYDSASLGAAISSAGGMGREDYGKLLEGKDRALENMDALGKR